MEVGGGGGPYRVWQSMSSHVEHRSYDFADPSMSCLSSPTLGYLSFYQWIFNFNFWMDLYKIISNINQEILFISRRNLKVLNSV